MPLTDGGAADAAAPLPLQYFDPDVLDRSDLEVAATLWAWWIGVQADRKGLHPLQVTEEIAGQIAVATQGIDVLDVRHLWLAEALRACAAGDPTRAAHFIRAGVRHGGVNLAAYDEARTGRRRQRAAAGAPRRDPLSRIIERIVRATPLITSGALLSKLRDLAEQDSDEIDEVTQTHIILVGEARPFSVSGIPDRLSKLKKKLRHESGR